MHPRWGARAILAGRTPSSSCPIRPSSWTSNSSSCRSTESPCHLESVHCGGASSARCAACLQPLYMTNIHKSTEFPQTSHDRSVCVCQQADGLCLRMWCMHMIVMWVSYGLLLLLQLLLVHILAVRQLCTMQERPEEVPTGELPQNMTLIVDRHLVGKISPGTRVTVIGIYSIYQVLFDGLKLFYLLEWHMQHFAVKHYVLSCTMGHPVTSHYCPC